MRDYLKNRLLKFNKIERTLFVITSVVGSLFIFLSLKSNKESLYVYTILFFWTSLVVFSFLKIYDRIILLMFLIAFFNFLMGRSLLIALGVYDEPYSFTLAESINGQKIVLFSIVTIFIGYITIEFFGNEGIRTNKIELNLYKKESIKTISKLLFYVTYPFLIISIVALIKHVNIYGYASIYQDFSPKVPMLIKKTGDIAPYSFLIFIGTMPSKKEVYAPLFLWIFYLILTLGTGARFDFVIGLMCLFTYYIMRNRISPGSNAWVTKKFLVSSVIVGTLLLIGLSFYNDARFGYKDESKQVHQYFTKFFYDQGININNNKRIFKYSDKLSRDKIYSLKSTVSFYERNIGGRLLGREYYNGNSIERAINSNSLADVLSLYVLGEEKYLSGHGVGTSYIAEVYHDFGYSGLFVINLIYVYIIYLINKMILSNQYQYGFLFTFLFNLYGALLKIPRSAADTIVLKAIDPMYWLTVLIIILVYKFINQVFTKNNHT